MRVCGLLLAAFDLLTTGAATFNVTGGVEDVLTGNVSLTRNGPGLLFNPSGGDTSGNPQLPGNAGVPSGTEWAFAGPGGNPSGAAFSAANFAALTFDTFLNALGGPGQAGGGAPGSGVGNVIGNQPGVLRLVADDIYLDITFLTWTNAIGGSVAEYSRSTVPVPPAPPLLATACGLLAWRSGRSTMTPR